MFIDLLESILKRVEEERAQEDTAVALGDLLLEEQNDIIFSFLNRKEGETLFPDYWQPLPANRVIKIWTDYSRIGFVRDEKGIDTLADRLIEIVARLAASTGLTPEELEENEIDPDEFWDWAVDENGQYVMSDYAWKELNPLILSLYEARTPEDKLQFMDRIFNIVHQRSDLSKFFVEGGSKTLDKLANE